MLTENSQPMFGSLCVEFTKNLIEVLINCQRSLLSRQVFNGGDNPAGSVEEVYALHTLDCRQFLKVFLKNCRRLNFLLRLLVHVSHSSVHEQKAYQKRSSE